MHTINIFMFISNTQLIYFNVDCKIYQAVFFKSPAKSKNFKAYYLLILIKNDKTKICSAK